MFANLTKDWRQHGATWLLTALVVVFGLQELRVLFLSFVGYLRDSVGMASLQLAPIAIGIFALSFLAGVLNRFAGTRNALWITAGGLALVRVAEQFAQTASLDLYLSSAATVLFAMYIPLAVGIARSKGAGAGAHLGLAFLLGVSLDSAIHIGARTLDLSWQPGIPALAIVIALTVALLWALRSESVGVKTASDGNWKTNLGLIALGPWLFLQLLIFQNTALFSSLTGWHTPAAGALLIAGNVLALYLAAQAVWPPRSWVNVVLVGILALIPVVMMFSEPNLTVLWLLFGQVVGMTLGMFIFLSATEVQGKPGLLRSTIFNGLGQILFVLLIFIYYAAFDIDFGFRGGVLPPVALGLVALLTATGLGNKAKNKKKLERNYTPAFVAAALLLIPLALLPSWNALAAQPAPAGTTTVRVMDYNLHDAVNTDGRVDPEALARVIEESGADVVALQEVSRGWLTWGGLDMLGWLSQRLDMPYVWGPTADAQWGNAIFSRYPIIGYGEFELPPTDVLLLRGFIVVTIDVDGKSLTLVDTHFSERDDQDDIRAIQSSTILDTWGQASATVIMGDFNALPDSLAITMMLDAGLIDVSREIGEQPTFTYYSADPDHQIDYIFVTPDLGFSDFVIPRTTASDHLPLVVTIELR